MNRKYLLLYFLGLTICSISAQTCNTPDRLTGTCINLRNCTALFELLQVRPLPPKTVEYLRRSNCGFDGPEPKVCCPVETTESLTGSGSGNNNDDVNILQPSITTEGPHHSDLLPTTEECGMFTNDRIIGGTEANLDDFPWMALIEYQKPNGRGFHCGGVLINKRYILTAAHCLIGRDIPKNWNLVSVRLGEYNLETSIDCTKWAEFETCAPEAIDYAVTEKIPHESYDSYDISQLHDIALLRLSRDVEYTPYIRPICLPTGDKFINQAFEGVNMTVAGWGVTENGTNSKIKLKVKVPVQSNKECSETYANAQVSLNAGQLCAGGTKGKDSCRGDSGGALMTIDSELDESNWFAAGIVSFGRSTCGVEGWPSIYTRVTKYIPWIISKLRP